MTVREQERKRRSRRRPSRHNSWLGRGGGRCGWGRRPRWWRDVEGVEVSDDRGHVARTRTRSTLAHGLHQLLAEERVTGDAVVHEAGQAQGQRRDAELVLDERLDLAAG